MASYDTIATWYDESVRTGSLMHDVVMPVLFELLGDCRGKHVCDLACGQGIVARELARRGATVTGVDIADKLLEMARFEEVREPLGISYSHEDAQVLEGLQDASFDAVVCNMALMDIPDIRATFSSVQRILEQDGIFVFSMTHPCFLPPQSQFRIKDDGTIVREVNNYFIEEFWKSDNVNGVRGLVGSYHRTLSTYLNALMAAGLMIEYMVEPPATGRVAERIPGYREVPVALIVRCRKQA